MKRTGSALALAALSLAFAAPAGAEPPRRRPGPGTANPSALIAAEIAFARAAREKGQWTAFRTFADENAVMFVPQPVLARSWLKGRKDPPAAVQWQPYQVWMSCDGTAGLTKGAWQRADGSVGYFTTIWKRQKKGDYRWVLDQGDSLKTPLPEPDMLSAVVADCVRGRRDGPPQPPPPSQPETPEVKLRAAPADGAGQSDDGTLRWTYHVGPDNARTLAVSLRKGANMAEVLSLSVAAEAN